MIRRAFNGLAYLVAASIIVAMAVMLACLALQVFMRHVFSRPPAWTEEMAILMFVWVTLGILGLGVRDQLHVRLSTLVDALPGSVQRLISRCVDLMVFCLGAYFVWSGIRFVDFTSGSISPAIGYPIELLHYMAPVSGLLIALFAAERLILGPVEKSQEEIPELATLEANKA